MSFYRYKEAAMQLVAQKIIPLFAVNDLVVVNPEINLNRIPALVANDIHHDTLYLVQEIDVRPNGQYLKLRRDDTTSTGFLPAEPYFIPGSAKWKTK
jgi:hypothetical protein